LAHALQEWIRSVKLCLLQQRKQTAGAWRLMLQTNAGYVMSFRVR